MRPVAPGSSFAVLHRRGRSGARGHLRRADVVTRPLDARPHAHLGGPAEECRPRRKREQPRVPSHSRFAAQERVVVHDSKIAIPPETPAITGELYRPSVGSKTGLVVLAYGTDGYVDNVRGPWKTMMCGYSELAARGLFALIPNHFARTGSRHDGPAVDDVAAKRPTGRRRSSRPSRTPALWPESIHRGSACSAFPSAATSVC